MREAIERVIAELEHEHNRQWKLERIEPSNEKQHYRQGGQDGLQFSIKKLKDVLSNHERERGTEHHLPTKKEGET